MKKYAITLKVIIMASGNTPEEIVTRITQAFNRVNTGLPADEVVDIKADGIVDTEEIDEGARA